jgi:hypothetical protein
MVVLDDIRHDDGEQVLTGSAPYRAGQKCWQYLLDNQKAKSRNYRYFFGDVSWCQPARFSLFTGLFARNAGMLGVDVPNYYQCARRGVRQAPQWLTSSTSTDVCYGPFDVDLAYKLGTVLRSFNPSDTIGLQLQNGEYVSTAALIAHVDSVLSQPAGTNAFVRTTSGGAERKGFNGTSGLFDGTGVVGAGAGTLPFQLWSTRDSCQSVVGGLLNAIGRPDRLDYCGVYGKQFNGSGQVDTGAGTPYGVQDTTATPMGTNPKNTRYVPAGVSHCCIVTDDFQDHFRFRTVEYMGSLAANPGYGDGATGDVCYYNAVWQIASATWSGGQARITLSLEPGYFRNGTMIPWHLEVGDEIAVRKVLVGGSHNNGYNVARATVTSVDAGDPLGRSFTYAVASDPGTATFPDPTTQAYADVVPFKMLSEEVMRQRIKDGMDAAGVGPTTRGFLYWGCRMPHTPALSNGTRTDWPWPTPAESAGDFFSTDDEGVTPRYRDPKLFGTSTNYGGVVGTIATSGIASSPADAYHWNGVAGAVSPAITGGAAGVSSAGRQTYAERGCMMAHFDDAFATHDADFKLRRGLASDGGPISNDIVVGDNGWQQCEDYGVEVGTCAPIGGKLYNRPGSLRTLLWVRRQGWAAADYYTESTGEPARRTHADLPLTVLDWHGLSNHSMHTTRDGVSLTRSIGLRALPGWGTYRNSTKPKDGQTINYSDMVEFRRLQPTPTTNEVNRMVRDLSSPTGSSVDWGTIDYSGSYTSAQIAEMQTHIQTVHSGGFDPITEHNVLKDDVVRSA